jgi:hypothetical protein
LSNRELAQAQLRNSEDLLVQGSIGQPIGDARLISLGRTLDLGKAMPLAMIDSEAKLLFTVNVPGF